MRLADHGFKHKWNEIHVVLPTKPPRNQRKELHASLQKHHAMPRVICPHNPATRKNCLQTRGVTNFVS